MRAVLPLLLLASCASSSKSVVDQHATSATVADAREDVRADTVTEREVRREPGRVTVVVEEFGAGVAGFQVPIQGNPPPAAGVTGVNGSGPRPIQASTSGNASDGLPPILLRRTTTVKDIGAVVSDTSTHAAVQAEAASETHAATDTASQATVEHATRVGPSWRLWLGIGLAVAVAAALAWHFRRLLGLPF